MPVGVTKLTFVKEDSFNDIPSSPSLMVDREWCTECGQPIEVS